MPNFALRMSLCWRTLAHRCLVTVGQDSTFLPQKCPQWRCDEPSKRLRHKGFCIGVWAQAIGLRFELLPTQVPSHLTQIAKSLQGKSVKPHAQVRASPGCKSRAKLQRSRWRLTRSIGRARRELHTLLDSAESDAMRSQSN